MNWFFLFVVLLDVLNLSKMIGWFVDVVVGGNWFKIWLIICWIERLIFWVIGRGIWIRKLLWCLFLMGDCLFLFWVGGLDVFLLFWLLVKLMGVVVKIRFFFRMIFVNEINIYVRVVNWDEFKWVVGWWDCYLKLIFWKVYFWYV